MNSQPAINQQQVEELLADFLFNNKPKAVELLNLNGVIVSNSTPIEAVQIAFLKAMMDSPNFRNQASAVLYDHLQRSSHYNYVDQFYGLFGTEDIQDSPTTTKSTSTATTSTEKKSGLGGFLGQIFTPDVIKTGINTGLTILSNKSSQAAADSSQQAALEAQRNQLAIIQAQAEAAKTQPKKGMSTGAIIGITVGSLAVVGTLIWLVVKMKKRRSA